MISLRERSVIQLLNTLLCTDPRACCVGIYSLNILGILYLENSTILIYQSKHIGIIGSSKYTMYGEKNPRGKFARGHHHFLPGNFCEGRDVMPAVHILYVY
jgi:hypothetical protein